MSWGAEGGGRQGGSHVPPSVLHTPHSGRFCTCLLHVFIRAVGDVFASGPCALLRCKKWRGDKRFSGDVACKHQSFGRCTVSKLAAYSPWLNHTPLSGLRLIVCRSLYEKQFIYGESNCMRPEGDKNRDRDRDQDQVVSVGLSESLR